MKLLLKFGIGLLIAFVILASLGLLFWARPTPILGVDGNSLAHSVQDSQYYEKCREAPNGDWICEKAGTRYAVDIGWDGCWDGDRISGPATTFTPNEISGCVNLQDHLRLEEALN
ncbi:MAG: hypothetical protein IPK93_01695 [Solirubrobacterales bacterium]|nr:hypothetical protein [Solirubrobacterales bacterium]